MAAQSLRNPQSEMQKPIDKTDRATGAGNVKNSSLGTGSGKVSNGVGAGGSKAAQPGNRGMTAKQGK